MKIVNYWSASALLVITIITTSLVLSTGEAEPAMSAAILLLSTLALGWGAGAHASRHEVDRLTRLERARRIQALCHAAERDRMEAEIERLQRQIADSTPSAYDWCPGCHTRQSTPQAEDLTPAQVDTLIASYTGLDRIATPDAFSDVERLVYAVIAGGAPAAAQTEPSTPQTRMDAGAEVLLEQAAGEHIDAAAEMAKAQARIDVLEAQMGGAINAESQEYTQNWTGISGAVAWHLIDRHADGWSDVGRDMDAWADARAASRQATPQAQGDTGIPVSVQTTGNPVITPQAEPAAPQSHPPAPDGSGGAPATAWLDILALQPLVEPASISKAMLAHREARAVLSGGAGPVAAVHLVNIGLTGWTHNEATATAYAAGWNAGVKMLRQVLADAAGSKS